MGKTFYIRGAASDGTYPADVEDWSSKQYAECELAYIKFFDAQGAVVIPTDGVLKFQFSPEGTIWRNCKDATLAATTVYDANAVMPYAAGMVHVARILMTSMGGTATTFVACFWRT